MSEPRVIRNLALVGFMGVGKSSVGRLLARRLGFQFVDTDYLVEARLGKSIPEIFAQEGEVRFRECERQVVAELGASENLIIATGGGLVTNPENLRSLKSHALVVCLWATPETILENTRRNPHRPLLRTPDPLATIRLLLAQRAPYYQQADVLINTKQRTLRQIAQQVINQFQLMRRQPLEPPPSEALAPSNAAPLPAV